MSSPESRDDAASIDATISCIQQFYHIDSHASLVKITLDRKLSNKLFGSDKVMMSKLFDAQNEEFSGDKLQKYAEKYSYEKLLEKFANQRGISSVFRRILQIKVKNEPIESHKTRKQIWLMASGAKFSMVSNRGLYEKLLAYREYPDYFSRPIDLDLYRTVQKDKHTGQEDLDAMRRLLLCFSRRNPFIGYCQGLNFIAHFILTMQFSEEEGFWLLSQLIENIIPIDYYTNMLGVVCDQRILAECIRQHLPNIAKKFVEVGIDPSLFSIEWFVCMFTSSMPFYLVKLVWDRLILEGMSALIKTGLILLQEFQPAILQASQFHNEAQIIMIIEQGARKLSLKESDFNSRFDKIYINKRGLKLARDLYREHYLKEKLAEKVVRNKPLNLSQVVCHKEWPICVHALEIAKRDRREVHVWTMRQRQPPNFIAGYCDNYHTMARKHSESPSTSAKSEFRHVESISYNHSVAPGSDFRYEDELIIGRMIHVCCEHPSAIEQPPLQQKEVQQPKENKQRQDPLRQSLLAANQMQQSSLKAQQNLSYLLHEDTQQKPPQAIDLRSKLRDSHAVDFMKRFVTQNKELGEIITSS